METESGAICAELFRDFLECFRMDYTLQIFIPECNLPPESKMRDAIAEKYGLKPEEGSARKPLLLQILQIMQERAGLPPLKDPAVPNLPMQTPEGPVPIKESKVIEKDKEKKQEVVSQIISEESNSAKKDEKKEPELSTDDLLVPSLPQKRDDNLMKRKAKEEPIPDIPPKKVESPPEEKKPVMEQLPPLSN